ncbi:MAG TPA: hypothetical protein DGN59_07125 [Candidatus Latescibacteria bacterium]|nr:hypothetical protein [Candidatus Latescibacterota bacterium]
MKSTAVTVKFTSTMIFPAHPPGSHTWPPPDSGGLFAHRMVDSTTPTSSVRRLRPVRPKMECSSRGSCGERWMNWSTIWEKCDEDLDADPVSVTRGILRYLDLEPPPGRRIHGRTWRLADDLSSQWVERYRRESRSDN